MSAFQRVCVFCGSRAGAKPAYLSSAAELGRELARRGMSLVYGGAHVGLMGAVADAALQGGAEVIGVIPKGLVERELAHRGLSQLHVVHSMHERKALMEKLSDAVIALPGGFGTWDELFEIVTWAQIGLHRKPIGALNVEGFFEPMRAMIEHGAREGFIPSSHANVIQMQASPAALLDAMVNFELPAPTFPTGVKR